MKIFTIEQREYTGYDSFMGFVIVANNGDEVKILAKKNAADEGKEVWKLKNVQEVGEYTGMEWIPFVLLSDFKAG